MSAIEETDVHLLHTKQKQLSQHNYTQIIRIAACAIRLQQKQSTKMPNKHYLLFFRSTDGCTYNNCILRLSRALFTTLHKIKRFLIDNIDCLLVKWYVFFFLPLVCLSSNAIHFFPFTLDFRTFTFHNIHQYPELSAKASSEFHCFCLVKFERKKFSQDLELFFFAAVVDVFY